MIQFIVGRIHSCFPNLAFFQFTVAKDCIHPPVSLIYFAGKGDTAGSTDALSQGTGSHIDSGGMLHIRMSLEHMTGLTKMIQLFFGEISFFSQAGIHGRSRMAFGKDKTVTVCLMRIGRVHMHFLEIKKRQKVSDGKRTSRMTRIGFCDHFQNINTNLFCFVLEKSSLFSRKMTHGFSSL